MSSRYEKTITLGELVKLNHADIQTGPFGTMLKASSYISKGTPVIAVKDIGVNKIIHGQSPEIGDGDKERLSNYKLKRGDILFGRKGAVDRRAIITEREEGWIQGSDCIRLRFLDDKVSPEFMAYYFGSEFYKSWIVQNAQGTTMLSLNQEILKRIPVPVLPTCKQRSITKILQALDDKIDLNNAINKNLEEMAQALFKRWFIDFEFPNENGEPYKSSGGEFEESEMGLIPKGWKVGTIEQIGQVVGGATPSKKIDNYYSSPGIAWVTPKDLSNNKSLFISRGEIDISEEGYKNSSTKMLPRGSVLFSSRAPIGYIAITKNELTTNQGFKSIIPDKNFGTEFVYFLLKNITPDIESRATGSTFKEISGSEMKKMPIIVPNSTLTEKFNALVSSLLEKIEMVEEEVRSLVALRDTLLPKLMSGEIRVPLEDDPSDASPSYVTESVPAFSMAAERRASYTPDSVQSGGSVTDK